MFLKLIKRSVASLLCVFALFPLMQISASAVAVTGVPGVEVTVDSNGSISESGGTVTATVKGSFTSSKTTTITVKNTSGSTATISFSYTLTNCGSNSLGGNSGNRSELLTADATKTFTITSKTWTTSTTATAKLSNFKVEAAAAESNVTVTYGSLGSVKLDGTAVASGSVNSVSSATGGAFVAVPSSGAKFVGWIDPETNAVLSTSATYQLIPTADVAIRAVFASASTEPCFWANGTSLLFESFGAAITYATSASNKTIALASDGTFPAGDYTIPAGITMLIPYDAANTLCTTEPTIAEKKVNPSAYRMLTMGAGANIEVNGALSVSGQQYCSKPIGTVSGQYGVIEMADGSSITVNNGGKLYVWGYIAGVKDSNNIVSEGTVTIKSGGTVYEDFQVVDWRGGGASMDMIDNEKKVFPMSQYYVQNVQVPMTLETGATENTFTSVKISIVGLQKAPVPFIGTGGMFVLGEDSKVTKDYIEETDRLSLELIEGSVSLGNITMEMKLSVWGTAKIDSAKYVLPVTNNITIRAKTGTTLLASNDMSLLPGAEIIVEKNAFCTLSGGSFYVYALDEWMYPAEEKVTEGGYCSEFNRVFEVVPYAHDRIYTRTIGDLSDAKILVNGIVDASRAYVYTTAGGANICSDGGGVVKLQAGEAKETYQVIQTYNKGELSSWPSIPITPAKLKNADGSFVQSGTGTYPYVDGRWHHLDTTGNPAYAECIDCGKPFIRCGTGDTGYTYEAFTLEMTNWYVEVYLNQSNAWIGVGAQFTGSDNAFDEVDDFGFLINGVQVWASDCNEPKPDVGTAASADYKRPWCAVETKVDENTAYALLKCNDEVYQSRGVKFKISEKLKEYQQTDGAAVADQLEEEWAKKSSQTNS